MDLEWRSMLPDSARTAAATVQACKAELRSLQQQLHIQQKQGAPTGSATGTSGSTGRTALVRSKVARWFEELLTSFDCCRGSHHQYTVTFNQQTHICSDCPYHP